MISRAACRVRGPTEFSRLARSINRMTARILEEQAQRTHLEKVASVGRLAAGVAHEIGNPLGAIGGYAHILRKSSVLDSDALDAVAGIERESARIDRIMRGMLEYARPRRRITSRIDLNVTVNEVVQLLRDQGTLREVAPEVALQNGLPKLIGDAHEMEQVLVNLILNAVDAMQGHGKVWIVTQSVEFEDINGRNGRRNNDPDGFDIAREQSARVRSWINSVGEPKQILKLIVADSGPGVPITESEKIFDPFYTTKEPGRGTGLGLAVVSRIVEGLGGTIWVRPAREGGAAFMMYFPVPDEAAGSDERPASVAAVRAVKILVVDDEPGLRQTVSRILGAEGHTVGTAGEGEEALSKLSTEDVDLVLCDLRMPKNGRPRVHRALHLRRRQRARDRDERVRRLRHRDRRHAEGRLRLRPEAVPRGGSGARRAKGGGAGEAAREGGGARGPAQHDPRRR